LAHAIAWHSAAIVEYVTRPTLEPTSQVAAICGSQDSIHPPNFVDYGSTSENNSKTSKEIDLFEKNGILISEGLAMLQPSLKPVFLLLETHLEEAREFQRQAMNPSNVVDQVKNAIKEIVEGDGIVI
jgi:hypothetical protein